MSEKDPLVLLTIHEDGEDLHAVIYSPPTVSDAEAYEMIMEAASNILGESEPPVRLN